MPVRRKYQVFVCSTFKDLEEQRQDVFRALWSNDFIPVGMEGFTPAHEDQWEYIKRRIAESDYFIVIVADRYGSRMPGAGDKSVIEAEYDYARSLGTPISRFVIDPHVPWNRSPDYQSAGRDAKQLEGFKRRLAREGDKSFDVAFWHKDSLVPKVISAMHAMVHLPPVRPGLVRGGGIAEAAENYGVIDLFRGLQKVDKRSALCKANRLIRIVLNDGWNFFKHHRDVLKESLAAGSTVQVMLLHPETISLPAVADKSFKTLDHQKGDILATIDLLKKELSGFGRIEVLGTRHFLSYAAVIGDRNCFIDFYFNFLLQDGRQDERVALECREGGMDSLYEKIATDFEHFWRETSAEKTNVLL